MQYLFIFVLLLWRAVTYIHAMYWEWLILNKYPSIKSDKIVVDVSDMGAIINTRFEWKSNKSRIYFRVSDKNLLKHIKSATKKRKRILFAYIQLYTIQRREEWFSTNNWWSTDYLFKGWVWLVSLISKVKKSDNWLHFK